MNESCQAILDEWRNGGLDACLAGKDVFLPCPVPPGLVVRWNYEDQPDLMQTTMNKAVWAVAKAWGISVQSLHSKRRSRDVTIPRFLVMYLMSRYCSHRSLVEIGRFFGMDHTTIMHGIKRATKLLIEDPDFAAAHERAVVILEGMEA